MDSIVLYCKSYAPDVNRVQNLLESIIKYNKDNIPFYISVPESDIDLFKRTLGNDVIIISDESIYSNIQGWLGFRYIFY
jgi:hypothetical protein